MKFFVKCALFDENKYHIDKITDLPKLLNKLESDMKKAAKILDFERAAQIRDQIKKLKGLV